MGYIVLPGRKPHPDLHTPAEMIVRQEWWQRSKASKRFPQGREIKKVELICPFPGCLRKVIHNRARVDREGGYICSGLDFPRRVSTAKLGEGAGGKVIIET